MIATPVLSTMLALAATFLGLSLLVQVFQEVYKYLTSSKARSYRNALVDFLGPYGNQLFDPGIMPEIQVRGPFQFLRRRPTGHLQPLEKEELVKSLERTAAPWVRRALGALRLETSLQSKGRSRASPSFGVFINELHAVESGSPGRDLAKDLIDFLGRWGLSSGQSYDKDDGPPLDASAVLTALRQRFLPHIVHAESHFSQLTKNFEYAYRRRNLRQTFTFGLLLALFAEQPFDRIFTESAAMPLDQAVALAERTSDLYQKQQAKLPQGDSLAAVLRQRTEETIQALRESAAPVSYIVGPTEFARIKGEGIPRYILGCLVTALLISFGAPFWNDLTGALLRVYQAKSPVAPTQKKEED